MSVAVGRLVGGGAVGVEVAVVLGDWVSEGVAERVAVVDGVAESVDVGLGVAEDVGVREGEADADGLAVAVAIGVVLAVEEAVPVAVGVGVGGAGPNGFSSDHAGPGGAPAPMRCALLGPPPNPEVS